MSRKIPKVASASLVLGAMGCGSSHSTTSQVAGEMCQVLAKCEPYFTDYYASVAACTKTLTAEGDRQLAGYTSSCKNAVLDYYHCYYSHLLSSSNACSSSSETAASNACASLYAAATKACPASAF